MLFQLQWETSAIVDNSSYFVARGPWTDSRVNVVCLLCKKIESTFHSGTKYRGTCCHVPATAQPAQYVYLKCIYIFLKVEPQVCKSYAALVNWARPGIIQRTEFARGYRCISFSEPSCGQLMFANTNCHTGQAYPCHQYSMLCNNEDANQTLKILRNHINSVEFLIIKHNFTVNNRSGMHQIVPIWDNISGESFQICSTVFWWGTPWRLSRAPPLDGARSQLIAFTAVNSDTTLLSMLWSPSIGFVLKNAIIKQQHQRG